MEEDLISRRKALDTLNLMCDVVICPYSKKQGDIMCGSCAMGSAINVIKNQPSVQPDGGTWIKMSDADGDYYVCDQCGEELPRYTTKSPTWDIPYPTKYSIDKTNFCPNCGADMRETDGSED